MKKFIFLSLLPLVIIISLIKGEKSLLSYLNLRKGLVSFLSILAPNTLLVPDQGEIRMLTLILAGDLILRLYTNDYTPVEGSVYGDFTQATGNGYSAATLTGGSWTIATNVGVSSGTYAEQTFTLSSTGSYYGYYITQATTYVVWAERFSSVFSIPGGGGSIKITPYIELS